MVAAVGCEFHKITSDEILRDRLIFGIRDKGQGKASTRVKFNTYENWWNLPAGWKYASPMKLLKDTQETDVNIVNKSESESSKKTINHRWRQRALGQGKQCGNCGYQLLANLESSPGVERTAGSAESKIISLIDARRTPRLPYNLICILRRHIKRRKY